jgi:hypothetical protein
MSAEGSWIYSLATYRQVDTSSRDAVIAAAPESQNTHDTNKLTDNDRLQASDRLMDGTHKIA